MQPVKKLLIVDDELGILEEVRDYFLEEGFEVYTADTGKDGIDLVTSLKPDLMLLDMKLPDMSGIEVLKTCKDLSPGTRVVVATGYVDQKIIDQAERLGRDVFLQKPFNLEHLKAEIDRLLT
ncbi:MAG TPA: response regulator [bacterium]|nr:response regulator [bacterium]